MVQEMGDADIEEIFDKYDKNDDATLSWREFRHIVKDKTPGRLNRSQWSAIRRRFLSIAGSDRKVSVEELRNSWDD